MLTTAQVEHYHYRRIRRRPRLPQRRGGRGLPARDGRRQRWQYALPTTTLP